MSREPMNGQRGFALPVVLLLLILASAGSAVIVTRTRTTQQETVVATTDLQAQLAVHGAIDTATAAILTNRTPPTSITIGGVLVDIEVSKILGHTAIHARTRPNIVEIRALIDEHGGIRGWKRLR